MIKAKPLTLAQKLKNIVDIYEEADARIEEQKLIQKGALDAGKENDGIEPSVVRKMVARRKRLAKDPVETQRLEDLAVDYQFFLEGGVEPVRSAAPASDELSRVLALTNTTKPPKIEAIKKALGCSQGKAHKLRTMAAVRLAKSSSSSTQYEHEHFDRETGEIIETQPEDGDDGITGGEHGGETDGHRGEDEGAQSADDRGSVVGLLAGIQGGSQEGAGEGGHRNDGGAAVGDSGAQALDEAPATPSVGAVASESERVASSISDDDALDAMEKAHKIYMDGPSFGWPSFS